MPRGQHKYERFNVSIRKPREIRTSLLLCSHTSLFVLNDNYNFSFGGGQRGEAASMQASKLAIQKPTLRFIGEGR